MLTTLGDVDNRIFWTPSAIAALKAQADGEMSSALTEASAAWANGQLSSAVFLPFRDFVKTYQAFNGSTLWGSTAVTIEDYRAKLVDWRKRLSAAGVSFTTPEPRISTDGLLSSPTVKWALIIGGLLAGAYALSKVTDLGKLVKAAA